METLAGRNSVREALRAGRRRVERVLLADGVETKGPIAEILALCHASAVPVSHTPRGNLDRLAGTLEHQGVIAQVTDYPYVTLDDTLALSETRGEPPFLLALDALQDPQNVGSLLRTAEAVGVHGLVLPRRRAVAVTPAVSRASAGAVEHLSVAQVTNLTRTLVALKEEDVWVVGLEDDPRAQDYRRADLDMSLVLVVGSEGEGMHRLIRDTCDLLIRLPMRGQINSLNAAAAGSIALYAAWAARQPSG